VNEQLQKMRAPFPPHQISYLPKGGAKLAYVGHAALTDRLLDADPQWTWEPLALDSLGLPATDDLGGMWIKLTVCGVTRLGYGHAGSKTGGDAVKEVIGDALRNAAMRFGAALDLWHKGELHAEPEHVIGMSETNLLEWIKAIKGAANDAVETTVIDGLAAATEVKDREAYAAIREAGRQRKAVAA
jgi:hypothetical protein